jgi:hypothetical protein
VFTARSLTPFLAAWCVFATHVAAATDPSTLASAIPSQSVPGALSEFASLTGFQIIYLSDVAEDRTSRGAPAGLSAREALGRLLEGTGLGYELLNERTVRIFSVESPVTKQAVMPAAAAVQPGPTDYRRLVPLEEVVVTSNRREEPLGIVPISASVWTEEAMEASRVKGINEIGALTPGVEFGFNSRLGDYFTNIVIRGVGDRHGSTTTLFVDDTPLPPGRGETFLREFPVTFDMELVEVLRGPQGGRLGHETLAGAMRFIVNEPSLTSYSSLVRAEIASTERGEPSYEAGFAAGGPLSTSLSGFRLSAWHRSEGGYVDRVDPFTGVTVDDDSNRTDSTSFRGALVWAPEESLRIMPSVTFQSVSGRDVSAFYVDLSDPDAGELRNGSQNRQPWSDRYYLASLKLEKNFAGTDLKSVTSYQNRSIAIDVDQSPPDSIDPVLARSFLEQNFLFHETRVTSDDSATAWRWTAGVALTDSGIQESSGFEEIVSASTTDQSTLAAFGELSLQLTERLAANAGLRVGEGRYDSVTRTTGPEHVRDSERWTTPNFGLTYQADERTRIHLIAAEGYRAGGVYPPVFGCGALPVPYAADSLWSYEIGAKLNRLLDGRLDLDASAFHISWTNPRPSPMDGCIYYSYRSASAAVSNGLNLAVRYFPSHKSRIGLAVGYTDAHYTRTVVVDGIVIIEDGDSIGGDAVGSQAPWSITASIERDFAVAGDVGARLRAEYVYHSRNHGPFLTEHPGSPDYRPQARPEPEIRMLNLRALLAWARFETALFIDNALDAQPVFGRTNACCEDPLFGATTFRPRTIGISASWRM